MKKFLVLIMAIMAIFLFAGCGSSGGDSYTTNEAPLEPATPSNGTNLVVTAEGESNVGLTYTNVGAGAILVECGDGDGYDCSVEVYDAIKESEEETCTSGEQGNCADGFFWCDIQEKCLPVS